ncbi:MAG: hypothetical protein ACTSWN_12370 [Promethearchaeota archaeon]
MLKNILGITLGLVSTSLFNISPIFHKSALDSMKKITLTNLINSVKQMFTNKQWLIGALIGMIGILFHLFATNLVGISVMQPLSAFGFIILMYFGRRILKERLSPSETIGAILIVLMPVLLLFSSVSDVQVEFFGAWTLRIFLIFNIALWSVDLVLILVDYLVKNDKLSEISWIAITSITWASSSTFIQGGFTILKNNNLDFGRDFLSIVLLFFRGDEIATTGVIFGLIGGAINALGIYFLQIALQKGKATRVGPINQAINNILLVFSGIYIFGQQVGNPTFYILSVGFTILGSFLLSRFQAVQFQDKQKEIHEDGEVIDLSERDV